MINVSGLLRLWDNLKGPKTVIIAGDASAAANSLFVDLAPMAEGDDHDH